MSVTVYLLAILVITVIVLFDRRLLDHRADLNTMHELLASQPANPPVFTPERVADLPDPARRYFLYTIKSGTPLLKVVNITMAGRFGMGTKDKPNYLDFTATQVLAMPAGFVWKMRARRGAMVLSGSDSQSWTRFWLMGLLPVARMGGDPDHTRSAFGRYVAEAVFWTPAALLPGPGVVWEALAADRAQVTVEYQGLTQVVELTVSENGQPIQIRFDRWSNANPRKQYQLQSFGGYLSEFRDFGGFRLPTHLEAGNHFQTEQYFPFFVADVTEIEFEHG
ncbi:YfdQ family protein [Pseudohongiella sp. SYSU M77423]|uniref:YfdQ family protein n=1 Tax=unclassified Pseudohongiella TaxID=2629611 RepID=UPI001F1E4039|nr:MULTISPECIES: YfdQ family protein [unclassified Pseudohongiella]MDH7943442.1 YfdQ family protein [Pseudohongiella sp. SYSU M77423]MEC8861162.1 YfdQ family protein [Pseudomonadota bacterium]